MKSFFLSIITAISALFGFHSHTAPSLTDSAATSSSSASIVMTASTTNTAIVISKSSPTAVPVPPIITYPLGLDVLSAGQTYNITWQNKDPNPINYFVNLEFVSNGNYYVVLPLGVVSSRQQTLAFVVPSNITPKTDYQLYFSDAANKSDVIVGSQAFTIK